LALFGLAFSIGSDVKDIEVEVVWASFAGGVFLEDPELPLSCLPVIHFSRAESIPVFRFFVSLEVQSFFGPFKFDLFIVLRCLLVFAGCSVCIA